jgi:tRNA(Ile2) C34 agmatinyltransferase TiaS
MSWIFFSGVRAVYGEPNGERISLQLDLDKIESWCRVGDQVVVAMVSGARWLIPEAQFFLKTSLNSIESARSARSSSGSFASEEVRVEALSIGRMVSDYLSSGHPACPECGEECGSHLSGCAFKDCLKGYPEGGR